MKRLILLSLIVITSLQADYMLKESHREKSRIDKLPKNVVADMKQIPQDPAYYAKQLKPFNKDEQKKLDKLFNEKYFKPWELKAIDIPEEDFGWEIRFVTQKPIYHENGKVIPPSVYEKWIDNANMAALDSKGYKAITVRRTDLKALPTSSPFYRDPSKTGEGFPFDYNQNSAYHINLPLYVSHFSRDI